MKTIIAGSRTCAEYSALLDAIGACPFSITEVVSGRAAGVDTLGEMYAKEHGLPLHLFPADWKSHGKRAGYLRNTEMSKNAEALLAVWDGQSRGTKHMIEIAEKAGLDVFVFLCGDQIREVHPE